MGCDIHCFTEKKINGKWTAIKGFVSDYYDPESDYFSKEEFKDAASPLDCRNYSMFAVLADVRNGYGFAGCDLGDAIVPICQPKGIPDDVSYGINKVRNDWGYDGHSHSWLVVKEIMDYDHQQTQIHRGWVKPNEFKSFLETGIPSSWCGGVSGGNVSHVNNETMKDIIKDGFTPDKLSYYTKIQWETKIFDSCQWLFKEALNQLKGRCESKDFDDVRIVFWFDN